ncbi:MAG TPA: hypothetical protein VFR70_05815 [Flavobacterium sp.]|nr:hypothetical protein [Flavobacterium sp.]
MKKTALLLLLAFLLNACSQRVSITEAKKLNGYWEIEQAVMPDGSKKEYTVNTMYDFFNVAEDYKGYRKKVSPQLNGKFLADDSSEALEVTENGGKIFLNYKTPYAAWKEELKSISDDKLVVENQQGIEYRYKKAAPINLSDGEEAK